MAKKKGEPNKSLAIREYLSANPGAKPKEIVAEMEKQGITVSAQFVSTVKTNSKKSSSPKRRGRPAGSKNKTATKAKATAGRSSWASPAKASDSVSIDSLLRLKKVVEEIGSIEEAKSALNTLEKLAK
ncbi:hypothetical protein NHH03_25445 [Stieleria sp. TO1_6]|uniref:hypothetical protein n=1 Tax=Stieleria tagensis TaxID=2956795 RepID=UPI00209B4087|nr:hypothetical protein [Stieleria tagensis]MCO8125106.1 hypothetical protein [Stieleria tagensis]